jgi:exosortase D (VPLPA-CTERM-specific)
MTGDPISKPKRAFADSFSIPSWPLIALMVVAGGLFFWSGIASLYDAWQKPEYSHGFLIPIIAGFLLLKRSGTGGAATHGNGKWFGALLVAVGLLVGLFGRLAAIADIVTYGLLLAIGGIIVAVAGVQRVKYLWPAWLYLCFMLPLPNFIYWPLSIKLQFVSSQIGVQLIKLMGVPVFLEGNIIDLGIYQLQVAEACSGLRYLFPLASFGFLFAALYRGPTWHKALIFLSSIPITVIMNSVRIGIIGFLVDHYGIKQAEGFLHLFEGWAIFGVCILLLFAIAALLQRVSRTPQPIHSVLDLNTQGLGAKLRTFINLQGSRALWICAALACTAAVLGTLLTARHMIYPERLRFADFPMEIGDWRGTPAFLDFQIERVLGADDYVMADYRPSDPIESVGLLIAYYRAQNEGNGVHSPEVCLPAGGWEVSRWEQKAVKQDGNFENLNVNRAIIQKGVSRQLVYYWYQQRGRSITNDYLFKTYTVLDSIINGRSDGALVRVITPIEGADIAAAERRLGAFLTVALPTLPDFVPP